MLSPTYPEPHARIGWRVWFTGEARPYRVRACSDRYAICTKPFNLRHGGVLYTVVDFHELLRGTENLVFCAGTQSDDQCREMLERISKGETEISHRNRVALEITRMDRSAPDGS